MVASPHPLPAVGPRSRSRWRTRCAALAVATALVGGPAALAGCAVRLSPSGLSSSTTASTSGSVVTVPLQVVQQGAATLAIVPVTIDGQGPYPFILDTGASTSGVNSVLAEELDLPDTGRTATVSGVVSSSEVALVEISSWSIAGTELEPGAAGALTFPMQQSDSSPGSSTGTATIAGLLGSDQLSRFGSITLDYDRQQLRFTPGRSS